ncbi:MAG: glycerol-3-phosphate 1-O-acyltransferase PlsY [Bacteroidales bacterium]|nr:glycerol-3-phosphate 1-O-acyltransferase PlsY [Bacteroidales bacterium]
MIYLITGIILAYLIGSISTAVWVGRVFYKIDIREHGSKNAGATNVLRILGAKAGIPVLLFDAFKGWLAVWLSQYFIADLINPISIEGYRIGMGCAAVVGHIFPIFTGFKGGKGVATILGASLALYPIPSLVTIALFIVIMLSSRIVSLASVSCSVFFPLTVQIFSPTAPDWPLMILSIIIAVFIPLTHQKNILRLLKGEEKKFTIGSSRKKPE